jgi:hypothetical protein
MGQVLTPDDTDTHEEPERDYFARALALHEAGHPVTCTGCFFLTRGCVEAANAGGLAVDCEQYGLRSEAYFRETLPARRMAARRAGTSPPLE